VIVAGAGAGFHNDRSDKKSGIRPHEISGAILVDGGMGTTQTKIDNMLIVNGGWQLGTEVMLKRTTVTGSAGFFRVNVGSSVKVENCLFDSPNGIIHARMDDPVASLSFKNTWFDSTIVMQWGALYPWTTKPLGEWMTANPANASNGKAIELSLDEALKSGTIPDAIVPGMGCSRALLQRYLDFQSKRQGLLDAALEMAWKE
jgi:hypothetical protein